MAGALIDELSEWLRIPSISADASHAGDVLRAGDWLCDLIRGAGGDAELTDWDGRPLAVGELRASQRADEAPTILVYGHFDVQPPDPLELWESDPFDPEVRDGWLYARGVADDKGPLFALVKAATLLAAGDALPVNVRVACDGEEEIGGVSIADWVAADERGADAALIFDSLMLRRDVPAVVVATRGMLYFHVRVRTAARDLHSGLYGGAALNAAHALMQALSGVLPEDGLVPELLSEGIRPPSADELADWERLPSGAEELSSQGGRPSDARAAEEFYSRTWAEPSVDVHGLAGGEAHLVKTIVPAVAEANVSIRTAPGQVVDQVGDAFEMLLREAAPSGADVEIERRSASRPAVVPPDSRPVALTLDAFERVFGARPLLTRIGGSLPIVAALTDRGVPAVITGLALPDSNVHAPNERLPADYVDRGVAVARELYRAFAALR